MGKNARRRQELKQGDILSKIPVYLLVQWVDYMYNTKDEAGQSFFGTYREDVNSIWDTWEAFDEGCPIGVSRDVYSLGDVVRVEAVGRGPHIMIEGMDLHLDEKAARAATRRRRLYILSLYKQFPVLNDIFTVIFVLNDGHAGMFEKPHEPRQLDRSVVEYATYLLRRVWRNIAGGDSYHPSFDPSLNDFEEALKFENTGIIFTRQKIEDILCTNRKKSSIQSIFVAQTHDQFVGDEPYLAQGRISTYDPDDDINSEAFHYTDEENLRLVHVFENVAFTLGLRPSILPPDFFGAELIPGTQVYGPYQQQKKLSVEGTRQLGETLAEMVQALVIKNSIADSDGNPIAVISSLVETVFIRVQPGFLTKLPEYYMHDIDLVLEKIENLRHEAYGLINEAADKLSYIFSKTSNSALYSFYKFYSLRDLLLPATMQKHVASMALFGIPKETPENTQSQKAKDLNNYLVLPFYKALHAHMLLRALCYIHLQNSGFTFRKKPEFRPADPSYMQLVLSIIFSPEQEIDGAELRAGLNQHAPKYAIIADLYEVCEDAIRTLKTLPEGALMMADPGEQIVIAGIPSLSFMIRTLEKMVDEPLMGINLRGIEEVIKEYKAHVAHHPPTAPRSRISFTTPPGAAFRSPPIR